MRVMLIAGLVVLVGLALWLLSGGASRTTPVHGGLSPLQILKNGGLTGESAPRTSWGGSRTSDVPPGGPTIIRAVEPATYTAMPGDGPVSESGPGDVTNPFPPSRVTYITTPQSDAPPESEPARAPAPDRDAESRPPPPPDPLPSAKSDKALDRAIEGVPGEIR